MGIPSTLIISAVLGASVSLLTSCGGTGTAPANSNGRGGTPTPEALASTPASGKEATVNSAETVAPVIKAFCEAMTRKDEAALRSVYSAASLRDLDAKMKAAGAKSIAQYLEAEQISNRLCEVRNEKITGEVAIAELRTEGAPNGFKVKLVKEGGSWKLTNESPDLESVSQGK